MSAVVGQGSAGTASGASAMLGRARTAAVPAGVFFLYCYFIFDYYAHLSQRSSVYGLIRPTLLEVGILTALLAFNGKALGPANAQRVTQVLWILVAYIALSLPFVEWPGSVIDKNLSVFVKAVVFFFFTAYIVDSERRLVTVVYLWMGLQAFRVLEPLFLHFPTGYWGGGTHVGGGEFASRLAGAPADVINPNELGFVIASLLPFAHFVLFGSPRLLPRLIYLALVGPVLLALLLTSSRGGFLAVAVAVGYVTFFSKRKILWVLVIAVGLAVAWSGMSDFQRNRYLSIFTSTGTVSDTSAHGRISGMIEELKLGLNRPIVGHGLGTTPEAKWNVIGTGTQASHILYAEVLIELGIIGAAIFFWFLYQVFRLCMANLRWLRSGGAAVDERDFLVRLNHALLCSFIVYAVYSINYWGLSQPYWYFLGGLSVAFARAAQARSSVPGASEESLTGQSRGHPGKRSSGSSALDALSRRGP